MADFIEAVGKVDEPTFICIFNLHQRHHISSTLFLFHLVFIYHYILLLKFAFEIAKLHYLLRHTSRVFEKTFFLNEDFLDEEQRVKLTAFNLFDFIFFILLILLTQYSKRDFVHVLHKSMFERVFAKLAPAIGSHSIDAKIWLVVFIDKRYHMFLTNGNFQHVMNV